MSFSYKMESMSQKTKLNKFSRSLIKMGRARSQEKNLLLLPKTKTWLKNLPRLCEGSSLKRNLKKRIKFIIKLTILRFIFLSCLKICFNICQTVLKEKQYWEVFQIQRKLVPIIHQKELKRICACLLSFFKEKKIFLQIISRDKIQLIL